MALVFSFLEALTAIMLDCTTDGRELKTIILNHNFTCSFTYFCDKVQNL
jgi:hypothetical protein